MYIWLGFVSTLFVANYIIPHLDSTEPTKSTEVEDSDNVGIIIGPITGTVVAATLFFTVVACLLWKYKLR